MRTTGRPWLVAGLLVAAAACDRGGTGGPDPDSYTRGAVSDESDTELVIPRLVDVTAAAGLVFQHVNGAVGDKWMPETVGSGGGFLDFDGDGWLDIYLVNGRSWSGQADAHSALFRNRGDGTFVDVSEGSGAGISVYGMGAAFGDYDGDGDPDIYVTAVGRNVLLRNDGGRFTDVTDRLGVTGNPEGRTDAWSTGAAWLDHDRDGDLDLFVCNYVQWNPETDLFSTLDGTSKAYATPEVYDGDTCVLYRNEGDAGFADVTRAAGLWNESGKALGVIVDDFDGDGWPDLLVTNDTEANFYYLNQGNGTFEDHAIRSGVALDPTGRARAGMGVDVTDLDGDGLLAVGIGNFSRESVSLYTQLQTELFRDRAPEMRLARPTLLPLTFGLKFADMNLDGWDDLLLANGHIEPTISEVRAGISFAQPPQMFLRVDDRFVDVGRNVGRDFTRPLVGRGLATGDIDGDGDPDLLITTNGAAPVLLALEVPGDPNWLQVRLEGRDSNRTGVGALVHVFAGERRQRWYVTGSGSYLTQSAVDRHTFGLGAASVVDSVRVLWPDGVRTLAVGPVPAGTALTVEHPEARR